MNENKTSSQAGRPIDNKKTERIFAAINEIFVSQGIAKLSMERIARLAGVSKVTLYNRFGSLEGIIEAYVETLTEQALLLERTNDPQANIEASLVQLGHQLVHLLSQPEIVAFDNAMAASGDSFASLRKKVYKMGPGKAEMKISELLSEAGLSHSSFSQLELGRMLYHLWISPFYDQLKFTGYMCLSPDELNEHVVKTTHFFFQLSKLEE
ncbi:TetR/AcrR family transcriptional regulator [Vibrio sonorensis]|uniref:TetR/AcrR family transcriptional regulator n=1 Tax=Vibrio sonorensis TaxID=1004316 RepID=UPI0008D8F17B|nr:TetR/AcrR family transcriptional regulator [Vibrio sonorensis]